MHCYERTLWCFFFVGVAINALCRAAPTEDQIVNPSSNSSGDTNPKTGIIGDDLKPSLRAPIQFETTTQPIGRLNLDIPHLRAPIRGVATGPRGYLESRRRQTENRIQELEKQVNLLLEAREEMMGLATPDPQRESQTAIQYGLICERGDTVIVCLMKKVVILRREVSGIQRDLAELGKKFTYMEADMLAMHMNRGRDTSVNPGRTEDGHTDGRLEGQEYDHPFSDFDNTTEDSTDNPADSLPQQDPLCPPRFERVGSVCYYVVTDRVNGVQSAQDFCEGQGGFLARPRDSLTIHDLANHLTRLYDKGDNQLSELWVDGQYYTEEETWRWNDGQKIDSSIWGISDSPTKAHATEKCVLLKKELNYLAMPQDCNYRYFFVCQAETRDDIPAM